MEKITQKIHKKIKKQLKDFTQDTIKNEKLKVEYKHNLSGDYEVLRLTRYIFSDVLFFEISDQPMEKINWWISFVYKNTYNCSIAHQKFGFRIYVTADNENEAKNIAKNLEKILNKALLDLMALVEYFAHEALSKGEIIVDNQFIKLFSYYNYFHRTALHKKRIADRSHSIIKKRGNMTTITSHKYFREIPYYEQAATFSFFSMLEHLCVLFLAFRNIPDRENVEKFSNMRWNDKFKTVFDINLPEFKDIYDKLLGLARYRRNPEAHGGTNTIFSFYLKGARHKISCNLHDKTISVQWENQTDNFNVMTSFFELIERHPSTQIIFAYVKSGLNVSFSKDRFVENNMINNMTKEEIIEYTEFVQNQYDDMANMDW